MLPGIGPRIGPRALPYDVDGWRDEGGSAAAVAHNRREQGKSSAATDWPDAPRESREAKLVDRMKDVFIGRLPSRRLPGVGRGRPAPGEGEGDRAAA